MSAVLGLGDLFDVANRFASGIGGPQIEYSILKPSGLPRDGHFNAVVLPPNLSNGRGQSEQSLLAWIVQQHAEGAILCSACAGAFWLGHGGLLDGRPVTTHWALEDEFRTAFPLALLHPEHLLIDDYDVVTAGGVMAWVDLGLFLVKQWLGADVVSQTCRLMLIDPTGREQRNYRSFRPNVDHNDSAICELQRWMEENVAADLHISALASRASVSARTLQRRFNAATGIPISRYVQELRIEKARGQLERTTSSVSEICWAVGYEDPSAFSRLFKSICGLSANEYRKRFNTR